MNLTNLASFGWRPFFQSQLSGSELELFPTRVQAVHRDAYVVIAPGFERRVAPLPPDHNGDSPVAVGDWLLLDQTGSRAMRVLERTSLFKRKRAGTGLGVQLIAANIDTLFIVTSANNDLKIARLERYLALATEAQVTPVVLVTKADLVANAADFAATARKAMRNLMVETLDARNPEEIQRLAPWLAPGQTVALVGSSGVGKSTIVNTLHGAQLQDTQSIREDDSRGRHTTTSRSLHALPSGAWIIDTPGMRELQVMEAKHGIEDVFADMADLSRSCRFSDCAHEGEPGCAVKEAIANGTLDPDRFKRFGKLQREDRRNSETIAEARAHCRKSGRIAKQIFTEKQKRRDPS